MLEYPSSCASLCADGTPRSCRVASVNGNLEAALRCGDKVHSSEVMHLLQRGTTYLSSTPLRRLVMGSQFSRASEAASTIGSQPGLLLLLTCATALVYIGIRKQKARYPPGPRGWPIVGNAFEVPKEHEWLTYEQWSRDFSKCFRTLRRPTDLTRSLTSCDRFGYIVLQLMGQFVRGLEFPRSGYRSAGTSLGALCRPVSPWHRHIPSQLTHDNF